MPNRHRQFYSKTLYCVFALLVFSELLFLIHALPDQFSFGFILSSLVFMVLGCVSSWYTLHSPRLGLLITLFFVLTLIRVFGVNGLYWVVLPLLFAFLLLLTLFGLVVYENITDHHSCKERYDLPFKMTKYDWHLTFIRMYVGYNLIGHFAEKLFAGHVPFSADVLAFSQLGVVDPKFFVVLAGLCELGGAISISLGFFTRLGALGIFLYLMIATILGHHFGLGFIWANPGGGWEFPVLWGVLLLSFALFGADKYSIDAAIQSKYPLPAWVVWLMGKAS